MNGEPGAFADFSELALQSETPHSSLFHARDDSGQLCRLMVFSPDLSSVEGFRAAWRRDADLLRNLRHECLPERFSTGEVQGRIYVATSHPEASPLHQYLQESGLSWDEIADVGWQAASVVQLLHNSGLCHGNLDTKTLLVSDSVQTILVDTGVARWILAATDPQAAGDYMSCCEKDLIDLGGVLKQLAMTARQQSGEGSANPVPEAWTSLIADLSAPGKDAFPSSAREVQGRLGGLLLDEAGDAIDVVDARAGSGRRGRSIVEELFEAPFFIDSTESGPARYGNQRQKAFWFCLIATALAATGGFAVWYLWNN